MTNTGVIFNIQRFSVQDGPGVRTLVFLKGCTLRCLWCCNPESQNAGSSLLFNKERCIGCRRCITACPTGAITEGPKHNLINREKCSLCGECAKVCYAGALEMSGEIKSVGELLEEILKDSDIYRNSGGGVTLSGGEPLAQPAFSAELLKECHKLGIHTAIETCGFAPWASYEAALPYIDLVLFDLKHMDTDKHKILTGQNNELILENLTKLVRAGKKIIARVPLIPGRNTSLENIEKLGQLLNEKGITEAHLLPYHKLGVSKYSFAGMEYLVNDVPDLTDSDLNTIEESLEKFGIKLLIYNH